MQGQVEEVSMEGCRRDDEVYVFVILIWKILRICDFEVFIYNYYKNIKYY